jgi:CHASE3 domain sensor protein
MIRNIRIQRFFCQLLTVLLIGANLQGLAVAGIVSTDAIQHSQQASQQRDDIKTLITRAEVRDTLIANGVSSDEVMARVNSMSDQELATLHGKIEQLPAGQGALETVLLVFVILILLDLTGVTDIFPRI